MPTKIHPLDLAIKGGMLQSVPNLLHSSRMLPLQPVNALPDLFFKAPLNGLPNPLYHFFALNGDT